MDSDGDFMITFGDAHEFAESFDAALEAACRLVSEKFDKVAKGRADMDRFFDAEEQT